MPNPVSAVAHVLMTLAEHPATPADELPPHEEVAASEVTDAASTLLLAGLVTGSSSALAHGARPWSDERLRLEISPGYGLIELHVAAVSTKGATITGVVTDLAGVMLSEHSLSVPVYGNVSGGCLTLVQGLREGNRAVEVLGVGVRTDDYPAPIHPPVAPTMRGATGLTTVAMPEDQSFWQMAGTLVNRHVSDRQVSARMLAAAALQSRDQEPKRAARSPAPPPARAPRVS